MVLLPLVIFVTVVYFTNYSHKLASDWTLQVQHLVVQGPKNKVPWIEYNGTAMGDSQLIINFLNQTFNKNLNKSLSTQQRALAWAIQKWIEEFIYWYVFLFGSGFVFLHWFIKRHSLGFHLEEKRKRYMLTVETYLINNYLITSRMLN